MRSKALVVPKVWRSEWRLLSAFVILSFASIFLSDRFPGSVLSGSIISIAGISLVLKLPLFWLLPASALSGALIRIYDVRYTLDARGLQSRIGIFSRRIMRLRFEDVRSVEVEQSLVDRVLNIGNVLISTASTGLIEMRFCGISAPVELQRMIECERDKRQRLMHNSQHLDGKGNVVKELAEAV